MAPGFRGIPVIVSPSLLDEAIKISLGLVPV
jgi:hypothetical protein